MIIDSHTHINNDQSYEEYFKKAKGRVEKIISLAFYYQDIEELLKFSESKNNIYLVASLDVDKPLEPQLEKCEELFRKKRIGQDCI